MDIQRRQAADLMKQVSNVAGGGSPEAQKAQARLEIKAEVDPKVWSEIADFVERMLQGVTDPMQLKSTIQQLKDFAKDKQESFEHEEQQKQAEKKLMEDGLTLSPAVQAIFQAQQPYGSPGAPTRP